jgi:hypothetical protein
VACHFRIVRHYDTSSLHRLLLSPCVVTAERQERKEASYWRQRDNKEALLPAKRLLPMNKRTWNLEEEDLPPSLKKRASSLFSIVTAVEDDTGLLEERRLSVDAAEYGTKRSAPYARGTPATGAVRRPPSTSTEESSEDVGLCIDEDETISAGSQSVFQNLAEANVAAVGVRVSDTLGAAKATNKPVMECLNTGLVHEASSGHYDKSNPYHKEKPSRVLSVMDALENGQDWILERCRSLGSTASDDAVKFLDDEDYMRVHLPGYMQR